MIEIKKATIKVKVTGYIPERHGDWIDLKAADDVFVAKGSMAMVPLGISMQMPSEALLLPRSSFFKNYGCILVNGAGVIDTEYSGNNDKWMMPVYCLIPKTSFFGTDGTWIHKGDRIAQFRFFETMPDVEFELVESLNAKERGGFGSTGVK